MIHFFKYMFLIIGAFLAPLIPLLLAVGIIILIDTYYGVKAAKKQQIKIHSRKLSRVITKSIKYSTAVILFHIINVFILGDFIALYTAIPFVLTKLVTAFILLIEGYSIDEKIRIIYDGRGFRYWFKKLISSFKSVKNEIIDVKDDVNEIIK